jgi:membrane protein insertase Oxa1/YidC/SpoIIIJ
VGVISVTLAFFPAGLVLYWATNTVLSIAQQWSINRRVEAEAKKEWTGVGEAQKLSHRSAIDK